MACGSQAIERAQVNYCKARLAAEEETDEAVARATAARDDALDALLATPSRSIGNFADKIRVLADEYGTEWQPRHIAALIADSAILDRSIS